MFYINEKERRYALDSWIYIWEEYKGMAKSSWQMGLKDAYFDSKICGDTRSFLIFIYEAFFQDHLMYGFQKFLHQNAFIAWFYLLSFLNI